MEANVKKYFVKLIREQFEKLQKYDEFPLSALIKQAKKFKNFKEFSTFYSIDINHGYYWHLTENKDFKLSKETGPRDLSSMSSGKVSEKGALMVTSDLEYWDEHYNVSLNDDSRIIKRKYVALFDASDIEPKFLKQVSRGFGNEMYLDSIQANKLKLIGVYDIETAKKMNDKFHETIPQSEKSLFELWKYAQSS